MTRRSRSRSAISQPRYGWTSLPCLASCITDGANGSEVSQMENELIATGVVLLVVATVVSAVAQRLPH
jgi:ABC-type phosphate transport system permease subunit